MAISPMKKRLSPKVCCSPGGSFYLVLERSRNTYGPKKNIPVRGCTSLGSKKGEKGRKSSGFLFICINSSETSIYGSWLQIPYSIFKSYVYFAETPTCARLLDNIFLSEPACP